MTTNLSMAIRKKAVELGYEKCGIIKVSAMQRYGEKLREHIQRVPEAAPAYQRFFDFADPSNNYVWAKSIVVCVRRYGKYKIPDHFVV
jgi:epoxyqueuosine reductase